MYAAGGLERGRGVVLTAPALLQHAGAGRLPHQQRERGGRASSACRAYPAKKALEQSRRLGSARIADAIGLLADADSDVKGGTGLLARAGGRDPGGPAEPADPGPDGCSPLKLASEEQTQPGGRTSGHARNPRRTGHVAGAARPQRRRCRYPPARASSPTTAASAPRHSAACSRACSLLVVATVTADGRPLVGPVDGYFIHGDVVLQLGSGLGAHAAPRGPTRGQRHPPPGASRWPSPCTDGPNSST